MKVGDPCIEAAIGTENVTSVVPYKLSTTLQQDMPTIWASRATYETQMKRFLKKREAIRLTIVLLSRDSGL